MYCTGWYAEGHTPRFSIHQHTPTMKTDPCSPHTMKECHANAPAGGGLVSGVTAWLLLNCVELKLVLPLLFSPVLGTGTATTGTNQSTAMASLLW
jgi:hypothetical protein